MHIQAGMQILRHGKSSYVGKSHMFDGKIEINSEDGSFAIISPDQFRREHVDGDIQLLVPAGDGTLQPVSTNWLVNERPSARRERERRRKILTYVDMEHRRGLLLKEIVENLPAFCSANQLGFAPAQRTLRLWRYLSKGHESMLSPAWGRCGNRLQGPDELLLEAIRDVVKVTTLKSDRFTLKATWEFVEAKFDELWRQNHGDAPIPAHSIKRLRTFLRSMPWSEVLKLRLDGRTYRAVTRAAVKVHDTGVFWECVEMDATLLNILIRDEEGREIGRPVLYVAIDVASGYVVGLHLTIQKPSALAFVECLRFMLFPKPEEFDAQHEVKNRIEAYGKPITLRVDNGSEFIGKVATEYVYQLFGDTARCQPYTPQEKPHVERFIGIVKTYVQTLQGATDSPLTKTKRAHPKKEKLLTLEELRSKLYRFIYDDYALRCNELRSKRARKAVAPHDIWTEMKTTYFEPVSINREEFEKSLCFKRDTRKLGPDGIKFDGWTYHSDELEALWKRFGTGRYEFLYSDLDAVTIYVVSPDGGEPIPAVEKILAGSVVDRATATLVKKKLAAEKKELNARTFPQRLAELRAHQKYADSSRGRNEKARSEDMVRQAEEHVRKTMRRKDPPPQSNGDQVSGLTEKVTKAPRGRQMGVRK